MHVLSILFAQTQGPATGQPTGPSGIGTLFMFGSIFAIFYFLTIRPQQKQRKAHEASILTLKKGDQIVTAGGLVGEVVHIKEGHKDGAPVAGLGDHITIKCGEARLVVTRGRIAAIGNETT